MRSLLSPSYKNAFVSTFPGDATGNNRPRQTPGVLYSLVKPTPVEKVTLLAWSEELAEEAGIQKPQTQTETDVLGGNFLAETMQPYAACYAGHQFGNWAGQLGDGRAITLGEWETPAGQLLELQLKGGGPTPYSRRADGRAVLRSSVREYLMSEAMHYLGVPTTRALSLVATGEPVLRDMFYNGNPQYEPGAIVMRVAPSFLRFGNFEILAARQEPENLKHLAEWTIARFFPHITGEDRVLQWFAEVVDRTAALMVAWLRVGFVHGVMNTDNMSVLGLTIDYGPFSFLDEYDLNFTPNTTDLPGRRYAFGQQANIAYWNLGCLASALAPLFENTEALVAELEKYGTLFLEKYYAMMSMKLGLDAFRPEDATLIGQFEETLSELKPDMTIFYQLLTDLPAATTTAAEITQFFGPALYHELTSTEAGKLTNLIVKYQARIAENAMDSAAKTARMRQANPRFILRNYLLHQAIEGLEKGDAGMFEKLQQALKEPYSHKFEEFLVKRPDWASQQAGCSMLSCSS